MDEEKIAYIMTDEGWEVQQASVAWWPIMIADATETDYVFLTDQEVFC